MTLVLENLPPVSFCPTETAAVEAALIADFEAITGRSLYPGDPQRLFVEAVAYLIGQQRFLIDYAGKMNLISHAEGAYLDHLAALLNTSRLGGQAATTTLRYSLARPLDFDVVIPAGSRASHDGALLWATTAEATIVAGALDADAPAQCQTAGAQGSGLAPGQINRFFDRVTYVSSVANTTTTMGGSDGEGDARLRARVQLAPERLSACGPAGAYRYWALSASPLIADVAVWSPAPGQVNLAPWCAGGVAPSAELLALVHAAVSDQARRPLTDLVQVLAPEVVEFQVAGRYWLRASHGARAGQVQAAVATAVVDYLAWQRAKLGRDISPDELINRVRAIGGVQRVELAAPVYRALDPWQAALGRADGGLAYGGLADE